LVDDVEKEDKKSDEDDKLNIEQDFSDLEKNLARFQMEQNGDGN
jgi:hypothetical protein